MLKCQRSAFSLPDDTHYLNCAYMAPLLRSVEEAGIVGVRRKRNPALIEPEMFFNESEEVRRLFAQLVSGDPERVALIPATSYGMATIARNLLLDRSENMVVLHEQFPSNIYSWRRLAAQTGAQLRTVNGQGAEWNSRILESIDSNTALVAVSSVHWANGTSFDLEAIGRRAHEVGAAFIVDGTQSVGALPIDVGALPIDALVCSGYKWLLGPYSMGFLHVGERFLDGVPLEENWITRAGSERFGELVRYTDAYQPGARRFDVGERSNFALMPMMAAALKQILEWSPQSITEYCGQLMAPTLAALRDFGYEVDPACSAHLFGVGLPAHVSRDGLFRLLQEHSVSVSVRGEAIRVSPHVYNNPKDVERFYDVLALAAR